MLNDSSRKWWRRRRVQWPAGALLTLALAAALAIARSATSHVVVYNDSGDDILDLAICACGQSRTFHHVGPRSSVRLTLDASGGASEITILTNGTTMWHGEYLEPRGGYRAFVRLHRDGQVASLTTTSWWHSLLHPPSNSSI